MHLGESRWEREVNTLNPHAPPSMIDFTITQHDIVHRLKDDEHVCMQMPNHPAGSAARVPECDISFPACTNTLKSFFV